MLEAGFVAKVLDGLKLHALSAYPNECVGLVTPKGYHPLENRSPTPREQFDCGDQADAFLHAGELLAIAHSHPDGPEAPSRLDMEQQIAWNVPWGLVATDGRQCSVPYFWGDSLEVPTLEGRGFRHGPSGTDGRGDCYALIRDWYRLNRSVLLPEFPRDDDWWRQGGDLYRDGFAQAGFEAVTPQQAQAGDVVLFQVRAPVPNHAGILLENGYLLHHLSHRLSVKAALGPWRKSANLWLRYVGDPQ